MASGGRREGAGRKDKGFIQRSYRLSPEDADWLTTEAQACECSQGELIHLLIHHYLTNHNR